MLLFLAVLPPSPLSLPRLSVLLRHPPSPPPTLKKAVHQQTKSMGGPAAASAPPQPAPSAPPWEPANGRSEKGAKAAPFEEPLKPTDTEYATVPPPSAQTGLPRPVQQTIIVNGQTIQVQTQSSNMVVTTSTHTHTHVTVASGKKKTYNYDEPTAECCTCL